MQPGTHFAFGDHEEHGFVASFTAALPLHLAHRHLEIAEFEPVIGEPGLYRLSEPERDGVRRARQAVHDLRRLGYTVQADIRLNPALSDNPPRPDRPRGLQERRSRLAQAAAGRTARRTTQPTTSSPARPIPPKPTYAPTAHLTAAASGQSRRHVNSPGPETPLPTASALASKARVFRLRMTVINCEADIALDMTRHCHGHTLHTDASAAARAHRDKAALEAYATHLVPHAEALLDAARLALDELPPARHLADWRAVLDGLASSAAEIRRALDRPAAPGSPAERAQHASLWPHLTAWADHSPIASNLADQNHRAPLTDKEQQMWTDRAQAAQRRGALELTSRGTPPTDSRSPSPTWSRTTTPQWSRSAATRTYRAGR